MVKLRKKCYPYDNNILFGVFSVLWNIAQKFISSIVIFRLSVSWWRWIMPLNLEQNETNSNWRRYSSNTVQVQKGQNWSEPGTRSMTYRERSVSALYMTRLRLAYTMDIWLGILNWCFNIFLPACVPNGVPMWRYLGKWVTISPESLVLVTKVLH